MKNKTFRQKLCNFITFTRRYNANTYVFYLFIFLFFGLEVNGGDFCNVCAHKAAPESCRYCFGNGRCIGIMTTWRYLCMTQNLWKKARGMEKIIRNYDQFGSGLVYVIEINVIVCNVYSALEYIAEYSLHIFPLITIKQTTRRWRILFFLLWIVLLQLCCFKLTLLKKHLLYRNTKCGRAGRK